MVSIIVAMGNNRSIGKDNQLLWHLPKDLQYFKKLTSGKPIIMGRKTFESLPGILPNRKHYIVSRNENYSAENESVKVYPSIKNAIEKAQKESEEIFIIGGGTVYEQSINQADRLYITQVFANLEADTFFPEIPENTFELYFRAFHPKHEKHPYAFEFQTWQRK